MTVTIPKGHSHSVCSHVVTAQRMHLMREYILVVIVVQYQIGYLILKELLINCTKLTRILLDSLRQKIKSTLTSIKC